MTVPQDHSTLWLLGYGVVIGLLIAIPVGPVAILCVRRTLSHGPLNGLLSSLGAAFGDAVFAAVSAFGLGFIVDWFTDHLAALRVVGGVFLIVVGIRTLVAPLPHARSAGRDSAMTGAFMTSFAMTVTNPITLLSVVTIFAGTGVVEATGTFGSSVLIVAGVLVGSGLWWCALSIGAGMLHGRLPTDYLRAVNRVAGTLLIGFGIYLLLTLGFPELMPQRVRDVISQS